MPIIITGNLKECVEKARQIEQDFALDMRGRNAGTPDVRWKITMEPIFSTHYKCFNPHRKPRLRLIKQSKVSE